jgi:hypothetical protein
VYGISLQLSQINGSPYEILPNTTLNEKFNIKSNVKLTKDVYPTIKYFALGVGGSEVATGIDAYNFSKHKSTDAALFEHIPFVMRTVDEDLLPIEKAKYRFRKTEIINGVEYICYYLKVIDTKSMSQGFYIVSVNEGSASLSVFDTNTDEFLNPIPRDPSKGMTDLNNTKYISAVANLKFSLYKNELEEINEILKIRYGESHTKGLTEIGICSGVDMDIETGYKEATCAQVIYHTEVDINTASILQAEGELVRMLEYGGSEPRV